MEYYSPLTRKETLSYATTWMNLQDNIINEISQSIPKRQLLYDSTYMRDLKYQSNSQKQKGEWWLPGYGERRKGGVI